METVLVTGGLGRSGRWLVDRLEGEYRVVCVDRDHPGHETPGRGTITFRAAELTDAGEAFDLLSAIDPDAVVHWAAIPSDRRHAPGRVFDTNTDAAFNVLSAAGRVGARVVQASSEAAYGFFFAEETPLPDRVPVTEDHPLRPEDPYGASKQVAETVAAMVARRDDVDVASIRPSWIQYPGSYAVRGEAYQANLAMGAGDYWSYVDVRDVADMVATAMERDTFDGHEAFNCHAADNALGEPTLDLLDEQFGDRPEEAAIEGDESAFSTAKAAAMLDWEPDHTWRRATDEDVPTPSLTPSSVPDDPVS
jgi:nucleoside-diphosphate-sugar epimerase